MFPYCFIWLTIKCDYVMSYYADPCIVKCHEINHRREIIPMICRSSGAGNYHFRPRRWPSLAVADCPRPRSSAPHPLPPDRQRHLLHRRPRPEPAAMADPGGRQPHPAHLVALGQAAARPDHPTHPEGARQRPAVRGAGGGGVTGHRHGRHLSHHQHPLPQPEVSDPGQRSVASARDQCPRPEVSALSQRSVPSARRQCRRPEVSAVSQRSVPSARRQCRRPEVSAVSQRSVPSAKGQYPRPEVSAVSQRSELSARGQCRQPKVSAVSQRSVPSARGQYRQPDVSTAPPEGVLLSLK